MENSRDAQSVENATEAWQLKIATDHHSAIQHSRGKAMDSISRESLVVRGMTHHLRK